FLFLSAVCGPLISTLFPYTTLFRSRFLERDVAVEAKTRTRDLHTFLDRTPDIDRPENEFGRMRKIVDLGDNVVEPIDVRSSVEKDRKSTRLNSSHSQISYAVFCLKK